MLKLYSTTDSDNVINKTLIYKNEYPIKFKEVTSITSPIITLHVGNELNIMECNYCFISEFNRYYFIQDIQIVNNNLYRLTLDCDVLESFKDDILNSSAVITRKIEQGDYVNFSGATDLRKEIDIYNSTGSFVEGSNIVLSVIGG